MGTPKKTTFGARVKRTTTSTGIKKIRKIVRLFGRFMMHLGGAPVRKRVALSVARHLHYRRTLAGSQRLLHPVMINSWFAQRRDLDYSNAMSGRRRAANTTPASSSAIDPMNGTTQLPVWSTR